jgi:hypothetical protein
MRKLLLIFVLFGASHCYGAVAHVAAGQGFCGAGAFGGAIASTCSTVTTKTFSYTPTGTGNVILFGIGCAAPSTTNTISLAATSWTITTISSGVGASGNRMAFFRAYALNTSATTFTLTSTVQCNNFINVLIDEFSGMDVTTATSATNTTSGSGTPTASVTPTSNDNMIWLACDDSITAVGNIDGSAATKGADDTQQDWGEYRLLTGGSGVSKTAAFTGSGAYTCGIAAIQPPAGGVTKTCTLSLMGAGPC